jgi:transcriptional regulator NrdR family protein
MTDQEKTIQEETGLVCRNCGCRHFVVDSTRKGKNQIIRYRHCRHCGKRYTTIEKLIVK